VLQPLDGGPPRPIPKRWFGASALVSRQQVVTCISPRGCAYENRAGGRRDWCADSVEKLTPTSRGALASINDIRVGADCQSSAYTPLCQPAELWVARGLR
jgi:hypothetical protein